jgi:hypothetical protein
MKIKFIIFPAIVSLFFIATACNGWLNLKPERETILDEYWQSETDVNQVLSACYRGMTEDAVIYRMIVWGELRSDNLISGINTSYDIQKILDGDILSSNGYCNWGSFYSVINYCNNLLYYAPLVVERDENFTVADLHRVEAEALAVRSLAYFYLVRAFNEVPWIEDPSIDDTQDYKKGKDSTELILSNIKRDLLIARKYARDNFGNTAQNKGRFTKNGIDALLADVYLWNEQYDSCVIMCNEVLKDKSLELVPSSQMYVQVFYMGNSDESIFELQFDEDVQVNNAVFNLYGINGDPYGELAFPATLAYNKQEALLGAFSPFNYKVTSNIVEAEDDIRAKDFYNLYGGKYYVFKYAGMVRQESTTGYSEYRYRNNTANWIIYRLSDVLLMKAEALVQLAGDENNKEALRMINTTYLRSNANADSLQLANYSSKAQLENLVLRERQREFLFEGKRWFDLVRMARREGSTSTLNDYVNHKATGSTASLGAKVLNAMYMPISKGELEANKNMKQNPYYEEIGSSSSRK